MKKIVKLNKRGFTLIEMLIVLVVVSLLMAIIIPNVAGQRDNIDEQARINIAEIIETQSSTYQIVNGGEVPSLEVLFEEGYITARQLDEATKLLNESTTGNE
ncbi:prepilin-type N-terminal cleavage/methylation domain-containing protein [Aerococcaceae bacterium DSM 111021]|nr:prepilin-type N-terminal cleavage/methylation domain-containing protein [Aerococcaceae bacterium DSM 111021]